MFSLPSFLDPDYYVTGQTSWVIIESVILAFFISGWTALSSYRGALKKQSVHLFWLGNFALAYSAWNLLYLSVYSNQDIELPSTTLTVEFAHRAHLIIGILLPYTCHRFLCVFFNKRKFVPRLPLYSFVALVALLVLIQWKYYWSLLMTGIFIFGSFAWILWSLWRFY